MEVTTNGVAKISTPTGQYVSNTLQYHTSTIESYAFASLLDLPKNQGVPIARVRVSEITTPS